MSSFRKLGLAAVLCAATLWYGCATIEQAQRSVRGAFRPVTMPSAAPMKRADQITEQELEQLTYGFADRYLTYIITATENIESGNINAVQRRRVHRVRLVQVSAVYDIVTNPDPFTRLLDLLLVVTLQSQKWIEEDQAERWFGERAQPLILALRKAREDIWQIAARTMTSDQLEVIDYLIWDWRRRNPGIELVSYVRFDDFAAARGKSIIADVKGGGGLLAPVGQATQAVDEMRLLGERAFFYAKRLPFLLNWQMRAAVDDVLTESQAQTFVEVSRTMARLPQDMARERDAFLALFSGQQPMLDSMAAQYRGAIGETAALVGALTGLTQTSQHTLETLDRTVLARAGEGRPFDVREYVAAMERLVVVLQEANRLVAATGGVMEGVELQRFDVLAKGGTAHAQQFTAAVIDHAFGRAVALIAVFFVLLALYRVFSARVNRRAKAP